MNCDWCEEPLEPGVEGAMHQECWLRSVFGPVAHLLVELVDPLLPPRLQRKCSCFVAGSTEHDPPGMSRREAARAVTALYHKLIELGVEPMNERRR